MGILDGKNVVVTGGGRGIGRAYCLAMAREGANVVVNDVDGDVAGEVVKEIEAIGTRGAVDTNSVSSFSGAEAMIQKCVESFGRIDVLLNNAGILRDRMCWNMSEEEFDAVVAVHLKGTFNCGRHAIAQMRAQGTGGSIINVTSVAHYGNTGQTNYAAAKGGIASITYTWAMELARFGIRVNAISPGARTRMTDSIPDSARQLRANQGLREEASTSLGEPEQVAPLGVWLASDESDWVTGQIFGLNGNKFNLVAHPKDVNLSFKDGGWTVQDLVKMARQTAAVTLEPVGIGAKTYNWYDGVKPKTA